MTYVYIQTLVGATHGIGSRDSYCWWMMVALAVIDGIYTVGNFYW